MFAVNPLSQGSPMPKVWESLSLLFVDSSYVIHIRVSSGELFAAMGVTSPERGMGVHMFQLVFAVRVELLWLIAITRQAYIEIEVIFALVPERKH